MINIIHKQALRLVKERGFTVEDAVKLSIETQRNRGFIVDGKLTEQGVAYGSLSSEERAKVRKSIENGADIKKFDFTTGKALYKNE